MARTERTRIRSREDVLEMPDWMKEKRCPHKKRYMSGKRIMPKNLTGKENLVHIVDKAGFNRGAFMAEVRRALVPQPQGA